MVTDELDGVVGRACAHRRFWYPWWGEFSANLRGAGAGAGAGIGGHEDGPCVAVVDRDVKWERGVWRCARNSDLKRLAHGVVVVVPGTGRRRRGKVGSSWGFGPDTRGTAGSGLLILLRGPSQDT